MSEHRAFFQDTVERILADTLDHAGIETAEQGILPKSLYDAFVENGLSMTLVPEASGGIGADLGDAAVILRACGNAAAPGPIVETIVGHALLAQAGREAGAGLVALAFAEKGATTVHDVPWAMAVDTVLVVTSDGLHVTRPGDWNATRGHDIAGEPRETIAIAALPAPVALPAGGIDPFALASLLRSAQSLGAIDWVLRRSIDYACERAQFGREIAKFQAIQQMLAELADHALAAAGILDAAAATGGISMIAAARSRIADAADAAITIGHQVHGALGFSKEYALNHRTRRLMAWRDDFGSVLHWRRTLATAFIDRDRVSLWPGIVDAASPTPLTPVA